MSYSHFLWSDLSTFDMAAAKSDYAHFFSWSFSGDRSYDYAMLRRKEIAAIFPMPERLAEIGMPSFWMSYVHVANLDETVEKARCHDGVIIEVEPQAFSSDARFALVRDPSGAGFTLYEGPDITPRSDGIGRVTARYHHVPEIGLVVPFYRDLFGWEFAKVTDTPWAAYAIRHPDGSTIAEAEEVPEAVRGKYRYWMPCFAVQSAEQTVSKIRALNGKVAAELTEGRFLVADRQGAHFMIRSVVAATNTALPARTGPRRDLIVTHRPRYEDSWLRTRLG